MSSLHPNNQCHNIFKFDYRYLYLLLLLSFSYINAQTIRTVPKTNAVKKYPDQKAVTSYNRQPFFNRSLYLDDPFRLSFFDQNSFQNPFMPGSNLSSFNWTYYKSDSIPLFPANSQNDSIFTGIGLIPISLAISYFSFYLLDADTIDVESEKSRFSATDVFKNNRYSYLAIDSPLFDHFKNLNRFFYICSELDHTRESVPTEGSASENFRTTDNENQLTQPTFKLTRFTSLLINIGVQIMPAVKMIGIEKEVGFDIGLNINPFLLLRESFIYSHLFSKDIGMDFIFNGPFKLYRAETESFNANAFQLITDLLFRFPTKHIGIPYLFTGAGLNYKGEETTSIIRGMQGNDSLNYITRYSSSFYDLSFLCSGGIGWDTPIKFAGQMLGFEVAYKCTFNRNEKSLLSLGDNSAFTHIITAGIYFFK